jgi:hypothetical protein
MNRILFIRGLVLALGVGLALSTFDYYFRYGYHPVLLVTWLSSLIIIAAYLFIYHPRGSALLSLSKVDIYVLIFLYAIFAPLYLVKLYTLPWQINSDEVVIAQYARELLTKDDVDLFGPSNYFRFPALIFVVFGRLAEALGGVTFFNMRSVHALSGLAIIIPAYFFFRLHLSRFLASMATMLVMSNHALLFISRMVLRNNVGLLNEVVALFFLYQGLKRQSLFHAFVGGALAGFSFYQYSPSRIIFGVWIVYLIVLGIYQYKATLRPIIKIGAVSCSAFVIAIIPMVIATMKLPELPVGQDYEKQQLLIYPEGRLHQQQWSSTLSPVAGVKKNILNGLTMFNRALHDQGYMYPNYGLGSGFVDPITGILLWVGVVSLLFKRQKKDFDVLIISSFIILWAIFIFIVNKTPFYTRLLIMLPFVALCVVIALHAIATLLKPKVIKLTPHLGAVFIPAVISIGVIIIVGWNLALFWNVNQVGVAKGNDIGGTARYIEARAEQPNHTFYLVADQAYPYYDWGLQYMWKGWLGFFAQEGQETIILPSEKFIDNIQDPPLTLFMNRRLWRDSRIAIKNIAKNVRVHNIKPDGSLVAVEITDR